MRTRPIGTPLTEQEAATVARFDAAPPLPESWEELQHHQHRLHVHNGEPCCVAGVDECGGDDA